VDSFACMLQAKSVNWCRLSFNLDYSVNKTTECLITGSLRGLEEFYSRQSRWS